MVKSFKIAFNHFIPEILIRFHGCYQGLKIPGFKQVPGFPCYGFIFFDEAGCNPCDRSFIRF